MMHIEITAQQTAGCTDFIPHPERLHLGSQYAEGVDTLSFALPEAWAGKTVSLHIEQENGTLPTPLLLDGEGRVAVDRRLTAARAGRWMLTATDGAGYTAYTHPGTYDTCEIIATDGFEDTSLSTPYEQFVAQVLEGAQAAAASSQAAALHAQQAQTAAAQANQAAQTAGTQAGAAAAQAEAAGASADRAEAAARRAEGAAPVGGAVVSVNGKGGRVELTAADVGALPLPAQPEAGCLLRVQAVEDGAVTTETVPESDLTSFVRRTDRPTAQQAGPVKVGEGRGLTLTQEGELQLDPADAQMLEAMEDAWSPLTPVLVPLAVKRALTALWESAAWTGQDQTQACTTLGAATAAALEALVQRVEALELKYNTDVTQNFFTADLSTLNNLTASGTWNAGKARLEF